MALFRKTTKPADVVLIHGRCWDNPQLDQAVTRADDAELAPPERVEAALGLLTRVRLDPEAVVQAQTALAFPVTDCLEAVREAAAARAGDPAAWVDATALLANALVVASYRIGQAVAADAGETAGEAAGEAARFAVLEEADELAADVLRVDPTHAGASHVRLFGAIRIGVPMDEFWHRFEVSRALRPTMYPSHWQMLQVLTKDGHGSHEQMFDFARRAAAQSPDGDPIGAMLALAHAEFLVAEGHLEVPDADLELVRVSADRWVNGGEAALRHPRALEAHQLFGWFLRADPARRYFHLSRTQGRLAYVPWAYLRDGELAFRNLLGKGES